MHIRWKIVCGLLAGLLLISLGFNVYIFNLAQRYYRDMNIVRLDPLGLDSFADELVDSEQTSIVFYGDSRAQEWPFPESVEAATFYNRGIGNQTSSQVALRFDTHIRPLSPDVIVLQICINDLKTIPLFPERQDAVISKCQSNVEQIIADSREIGAKVILTTIFPVGDVPLARRFVWSDDVGAAVREVNDSIVSLAAEDVIVFDAYTLLVAENGLLRDKFSRDELHLNAEGYAVLNATLIDMINQLTE